MRNGALLPAMWLAFAVPAPAEPTRVVVRVLSQDAKFVGDQTGGARVTIRNTRTGKVLARGVTKGGTGNTDRIMGASGRAPLIHTDDSASFATMIDVAEPTLIDLDVEGPIGRPQSLIRVTSQRWIVPGEAIDQGNGWLVELPGLAITPLATRNGDALAVEAKVELMCGCPITPGGRWDAADYRVKAVLWSREKKISETPLSFTGATGTFAGSVVLARTPGARLYVHAVNVKTGNSGLVRVPVS